MISRHSEEDHKMNTKQVAMNWGLVFDGLLFKTFNACGRYKGTETAKRPQWLKDHPNDFTRLADMLVKAETDVATDVIEQEVDSISNVPCPGQLDPDKAHGDAQLEQTLLRGSRLPGQPATARGRPEADDQHFRVPTPTQMITMGTDQITTSETNGSGPDTTPRGAPSQTRGPSGGRRRKKQKSSTGTSKSAPKLSPERMLIVLESLEKVPPTRWQLGKQAFITKLLRIGGRAARLATMVMSWCGKTFRTDFTYSAR
jgi:hypothetical protein